MIFLSIKWRGRSNHFLRGLPQVFYNWMANHIFSYLRFKTEIYSEYIIIQEEIISIKKSDYLNRLNSI